MLGLWLQSHVTGAVATTGRGRYECPFCLVRKGRNNIRLLLCACLLACFPSSPASLHPPRVCVSVSVKLVRIASVCECVYLSLVFINCPIDAPAFAPRLW